MKQIIFILMMAALTACNAEQRKPDKHIQVRLRNGSGWNLSYSTILCDSIQMIGTTRANIWLNGRKMSIAADRISISNTPAF